MGLARLSASCGPGRTASGGAGEGRRRRILLVATMRNEGPFILEWVAYHLAIGFTDIVICTNDCVDGSSELLDRLQDCAPVIHLRNPAGPGEKPQLAAYARAERLPVIAAADWAMVLDADEFLNIHVGEGAVPDLIAAVPDATAFLINWRIFGNSGHREWRPGFVTGRFTRAARRADPVNGSFKTLFTRIDAYQCRLLPHQPRYPRPERLPELCYVNGAGAVLPRYFCDESRGGFLQSEPGTVSWKLAQINHYNTRSWEDYLVKHQRGGGLDISWEREECWRVFNKNDESDFSIAAKLPAARAVFRDLWADPEVRRGHRRCCALYRRHVAALKECL
ncbi:MAG TPA: glycosyltransferase family 2 protein [Stellaceae bacterium]|nr:glycosyltransferase family 2 protein [Stellaceae bacterium]